MKNLSVNMKFEAYITLYLKREEKFVKESSYGIYSAHVYNKIIPYFKRYTISEITNELIQSFSVYLLSEGNFITKNGLALSTVKSIIIFLKSSIEYLIKQGVIKSFDTNIKMLTHKKPPQLKLFNDFEIILIRDYLKQHLCSKNIGILICIYSGIRIGELCALKWEDIDKEDNTINVSKTLQRVQVITSSDKISKLIETTPKSFKSIRKIPINNEIKSLILTSSHDGYILSCSDIPIEPRSLRYHYNTVLKNLNIKSRPFHSLRHTFATRLIANTNDFKTVSELLGHSSISITLDVYTHTSHDTKISCINKY